MYQRKGKKERKGKKKRRKRKEGKLLQNNYGENIYITNVGTL
jgi:hypothetical protein